MDRNKIINLLEGIILIVLGILVAINGWSTMDKYFGIVLTVVGACLLVLELVILIKGKVLTFNFLALGGVALSLGIALLAEKLSFGVIVGIFIFALIGLGGALVLYGIYTLVTGAAVPGIIQIVLGALMLTVSILYLNVEDFRNAFWVIVGILLAVYGTLIIVLQFVDRKKLGLKN